MLFKGGALFLCFPGAAPIADGMDRLAKVGCEICVVLAVVGQLVITDVSATVTFNLLGSGQFVETAGIGKMMKTE